MRVANASAQARAVARRLQPIVRQSCCGLFLEQILDLGEGVVNREDNVQ
jgi:hypothetical protein